MATGQAAGTIGEIAELLGDERGLLRRPSRPSKGKGGKSSSNGPMMSSKGTAAGVYAKVEDPWLNADPWSTGGAGGGGGGGGLRPQDNGRGSGSTVLSPTEARPVEAWGDNGSGNGSTRPPPTEARGNNENGSGSTGPPSTEVSPESLVEKLSRFLLAKPNLISQRKEVLLASCERGHKLVDSMQLSSSIVEEAFRLARRRLAEAAAPAEPEAATETDAKQNILVNHPRRGGIGAGRTLWLAIGGSSMMTDGANRTGGKELATTAGRMIILHRTPLGNLTTMLRPAMLQPFQCRMMRLQKREKISQMSNWWTV